MPRKSSGSVQVFYPKFNREEIIQALTQKLGNLQRRLPCLLVVLFGSYAKGNYTVASDVDLLVIYQGKETEEAYAIVKRAFNMPHLEPHVYSEHEYREMRGDIEKMIRGGITIYRREESE